MTLTWLANTSQGYMVGDYISTSIPTGTDNVAPAFELAAPPTGTQFREATFTDGGNTTAPVLSPNAAATPAPLPLLSR